MELKIKLKYGISLIRPFLNSKKRPYIYIKEIILKIIKDPTNTNKKFLRTNIRNLKKIEKKA